MAASKTYRWGIVGAGGMAQALAADLVYAPGCEVGGVFSRTPEAAQALARRFGGRAYASLDALLADASIDLIYIASPNPLHYPQARAALQAGKPVLCEKPFTLNAIQLQDLIGLAGRQGLFLMEAMWTRWLPLQVRLRQLLAEGAVGQPMQLQAGFHSRPPAAADNRFYSPRLGGGALLDLGVYPLSLASQIFGKPAEVISSVQLAATGVDEYFAAEFRYLSGASAQLSAGFDGVRRQDIVLLGSQGELQITLDQGGWKQRQLSLSRNGRREIIDLPYLGNGYSYQAAEVLRCLEAGLTESETMPLAESLAILQTMDGLRAKWGLRYPGEDEPQML